MADKIRVSNNVGGGGVVGLINPVMGMVTNYGIITSVVNDVIGVGSGAASYGTNYVYPHMLFISETSATNDYGWPGSNGGVTFGHNATHSSGTPVNFRGVYAGPGATPVAV